MLTHCKMSGNSAKKATRKTFGEIFPRKNAQNNSAMQSMQSNKKQNLLNGEVISPAVAKKNVKEILSAYFSEDIAKKSADFGYQIYKKAREDEDIRRWVKITTLLCLFYIGQPSGLVDNYLNDVGAIRYIRQAEPVPTAFWRRIPKFLGLSVQQYTPSQFENLVRRFGPTTRPFAFVVKRGIVTGDEGSSIVALLLSILMYVYFFTRDPKLVLSLFSMVSVTFSKAVAWYSRVETSMRVQELKLRWGAIGTVLKTVLASSADDLNSRLRAP
jgi:hypothetical protein